MNPQVKNQQLLNDVAVGYRRILVAVDYLDSTPDVFTKALEIAQIYGSRIMVFHAVQGELPGVSTVDNFGNLGAYSGVYYQELNEFYAKARDEALDRLISWLREFTQRAEDLNLEAEFDYKLGDPGAHICSMAKSWGSDLIIVGRSGKSGISELVMGSVSNYVVHHAPCSVLVIQ